MNGISSDKTSKFLEAINKYAREQKNKLSEEAERLHQAEKVRAEDEILRDAYNLIRKEMSEMIIKISSDRSKQETESRKKLFEKRSQITKEVFNEARNKLKEFVFSEDYYKYMHNSIIKVCEIFKSGVTTLFLCERDIGLSEDIEKIFLEKKLKIQVSSDIEIGGLRAANKNMGMIVDETLDSKLLSQYEWFIESSGLIIS